MANPDSKDSKDSNPLRVTGNDLGNPVTVELKGRNDQTYAVLGTLVSVTHYLNGPLANAKLTVDVGGQQITVSVPNPGGAPIERVDIDGQNRYALKPAT